MYKSPIEIFYGEMQTQLEGAVMKAVQSVDVDVDREELIRALQYDRDQYSKGYFDGVEKETPKWIPAKELFPGDEWDRVLVATDCDCPVGNQKIDTDRYVDGRWVRYGDRVTHWMPLPQPPKGE